MGRTVIALDASGGTRAEAWEVGNDAAAGEETWLPGSTLEPAQLLAMITARNMVRNAADLLASDILRVSHPTRPRAVRSTARRYFPGMQRLAADVVSQPG